MRFPLLTIFFNFPYFPVLSLQLVKWLLCQHIINKVLNCFIIFISINSSVRCCCPWPCQVGIRGWGEEVDTSLHSFLIWALNGDVLPTSHLGRFSPKGNQLPIGWTSELVRMVGEESPTSPAIPISSSKW